MVKRASGRLLTALVALALTAALAWAPAAQGGAGAEPSLIARASVEQVQVTGATPGARVKLLRRGEAVDSKRAGELGGVVFRRVEPGGGYAVREPGGGPTPKLRVLSRRSAPPRHCDLRPDPARRRLRLPDHPRRDRARDQRPPPRPGRGRSLSDRGRVRRLRLRRPGRTRERDPAGRRSCSGTRSSTSTCAVPAVRAAPMTTSSPCSRSTATTWSRPSPASRGRCTTRRG